MTPPEPFAAFMARALYDPRRGYYSRNIRSVGSRGDFATSVTLSPLLGRSIARWLREEMRLFPNVRDIIECGPGDGSLMSGVLTALPWWARLSFRFHLVETSQTLRAVQQSRLDRRAIMWHADLAAALKHVHHRAFIFHNELLDAFPVSLVQWHEHAWHEVWIARNAAAAPVEELRPLASTSESASAFSALRWTPPTPGQRCELHSGVREWLHAWAPLWSSGAMLTIDYGSGFPELYHRRPAGTLRGYLLHQRLVGLDVYRNPGRQDLTSDINFTDFRQWCLDLGMHECAYGTQAEFIRARARPAEPADHALLDHDGAGGAFKYLIHRRLRR